MLIDAYDLEVSSPPCDPGSERWSAFARLRRDIGEALPYLNAVWPEAIYDHQARILTMLRGGRRYTLRPLEIAVSNLVDREHAREVVSGVVGEINSIWDRRATIRPNHEKRRPPSVLEVYRLLPGGNCKQCGEATCFVFASKLVAGQAQVGRCSRLLEPEFATQRDALQRLLGLAQDQADDRLSVPE